MQVVSQGIKTHTVAPKQAADRCHNQILLTLELHVEILHLSSCEGAGLPGKAKESNIRENRDPANMRVMPFTKVTPLMCEGV